MGQEACENDCGGCCEIGIVVMLILLACKAMVVDSIIFCKFRSTTHCSHVAQREEDTRTLG